MKNVDKSIKFCRQACKICKENRRSQSKFIFKRFERMKRAHKEKDDLKIVELVFEKARNYLEKAQREKTPVCSEAGIGNFFLLVNPVRNDIVYKPKSGLQWILQCH